VHSLATNRSIGQDTLLEKKTVRASISRKKSRSRNAQDPDALLAAMSPPVKVSVIFKHFHAYLTRFEQSEALEYSEVFYVGFKANKIKGDSNENNFNFDDERSDYKLVVGDHVAYRFEIIQILGKGSFGQVCKCFDHKSKEFVALKIIRNQKRFHRQAKVEIKVLDRLRSNDPEGHYKCIKMLEFFIFRKHICITFELLSMNLYDLLKSNSFQGFSVSLVKRFAAQIILALSFMKSQKIIHCDLKPENILLKDPNKSGIKIIDFGSSCLESEKLYTYIQSRFYRAPEIILGIEYTTAIDMWSLGCVLGEIHSGYPLFPGESEAEQLLCIMEVKGLPPADLLQISTRKKLFFDGDSPKIIQNSRGKKRIPGSRNLADKVKTNDEDFLDFLNKCFEWNPVTRISPEEALSHRFIMKGLVVHSSRDKQKSEKSAKKGEC
jgi:serine/threonine protein kinase